MNIIWDISESDVHRVARFVNERQNTFVKNRIEKNVHKKGILLDKDEILKTMLMCLLASRQNSGAHAKVDQFFRKRPFLLTYSLLYREPNIEALLSEILKAQGLKKSPDNIPKYFALNFSHLEITDWELLAKLENIRDKELSKNEEREFADGIDQVFKGFGSKQARNFLQSLGLTKYEIPIDQRVMDWMKDFGFPISFSPTALQDKAFYHFISDGIQLLCEKAGIYPCILGAVITSENMRADPV